MWIINILTLDFHLMLNKVTQKVSKVCFIKHNRVLVQWINETL